MPSNTFRRFQHPQATQKWTHVTRNMRRLPNICIVRIFRRIVRKPTAVHNNYDMTAVWVGFEHLGWVRTAICIVAQYNFGVAESRFGIAQDFFFDFFSQPSSFRSATFSLQIRKTSMQVSTRIANPVVLNYIKPIAKSIGKL